MKTVITLALTSILILACSKKDDQVGSGFPELASLYFDLKKSDGTSFEEGDIFYKEGIFNYDNELVFWEEWEILKKDNAYFSGPIFPVGWEAEDAPEVGSEWVKKRYYILKYLDTEVIDTIMVRDSTQYPEYRYFDIYLNNEIIKRYTQEESADFSWLVSLTKDEF
jgi:hypothetical protein